MSFFKQSPVCAAVDKATGEWLIGPDWGLNVDISEMVNRCPNSDVAKDAVKQARKRIKDANPKIALLSLSLMDTLIQNCDQRLHREVVSQKLLPELKKALEKASTNDRVVEKTLELIQSWAAAFQSTSDFPVFNEVYEDLQRLGMRFPHHTSSVPFTPLHSGPPPAAAGRGPSSGERSAGRTSGSRPVGTATGGAAPAMPSRTDASRGGHDGHRSGERRHRRQAEEPVPAEADVPLDSIRERLQLEAELEVIVNNVNLLSELLTFVQPGESITANELAMELYSKCQGTQPRIASMAARCEDETLLEALLNVNEELLRVFRQFELVAAGESIPAGDAQAPRHAVSDDEWEQHPDLLDNRSAAAAVAMPQLAPPPRAASMAGSPNPLMAIAPPPSPARPRLSSQPGASPPLAAQPLATAPHGSLIDVFAATPIAGTQSSQAPLTQAPSLATAPRAGVSTGAGMGGLDDLLDFGGRPAATAASAPAPARPVVLASTSIVDEFDAFLSARSAPAPAPAAAAVGGAGPSPSLI